MEAEEYHARRDSFAHAGFDGDLPSSAGKLHRSTIDDTSGSGIVRVDFYVAVGDTPVQPLAAAGHGAGVVMIQYPPGGQYEGVVVVRLLGGQSDLDGEEAAFASAKLPHMQNRRTGVIGCRTWPHQTALIV